MPKKPSSVYTLVQHSAMGYKGDPTFRQGLETRSLTPKEAASVVRVGGKLFNSYIEAENAAQAAMYPPSVTGMVPKAPGTFSSLKIDGLRVYLAP